MKQYSVDDIYIKLVDNNTAKTTVKNFHYMKTWPSGAKFSFGIFHKNINIILGIAVFGKSSSTNSKTKLFPNVGENEIIEMQRLWLNDFLGKNAESKVLSLIIKKLKETTELKIIWTYAGGCKNDCGIVYQSSGFMYLGAEPCNDFYLTDTGEYKNVINVLRFGKASHLNTIEEKARFLYGKGKFIKSKRYYYFYPLDRGIRRKMKNKVKPFPKDSLNFRKDQNWINGANSGE